MLANRMRMSGKLPPDGYTKALLHMNGANGSTVFTDETGKIWTPYGNVQIDTSQSIFGGASAYFDGDGDYLETPIQADFNIGSGDVTIDFWFKSIATAGVSQRICGVYKTVVLQLGTSGSISFVINTTTHQGVDITADVWHHCALVKLGSIITLYVDGVSLGTMTNPTIDDCLYNFNIGGIGGLTGNNFKGWIDEFRFSKGIARWTANFTPPTSEY
jgi:hypothetical protein